MVRLRLLTILLATWIFFFFNIERFDVLSVNLSPELYVVTAAALFLVLLLPDVGSRRTELLLLLAGTAYVGLRSSGLISNGTLVISTIIIEIALMAVSIWIGQKLSGQLIIVEDTLENLLFDPKNLRVLSTADGEAAINRELFRARRYERPVAIMLLQTPTVDQLQRDTNTRFSYQVMLQHRYLKTRVAQIAESLLYQGDPIVWHGDDLVICLPETERQDAVRLARQIAAMVKASINIQLPIGIASFPKEGLIYADLVEAARNDLTLYDDSNNTSSLTYMPKRAAQQRAVGDNQQAIQVSSVVLKVGNRFNAMIESGAKLFSGIFEEIELLPSHIYHAGAVAAAHSYEDPDYWVNRLPYQSASSRMIYHKIKRAMDILLIFLAAPTLLIAGLIVAVLIRLEDGGPIFFTQYRTGLGGRRFKMYKFRSMVPDADKKLKEMGVRVNERNETVNEFGEKLMDDPRITRIGKFIRKTSLDELPQLWNVLRGDMSLIGPRPTSFGVDKYTLYHTQRLSVKPGITGLWQIHDRGDTDFDNRLIWDIKYIEKLSLVMDIQILFRTVWCIVRKHGAR